MGRKSEQKEYQAERGCNSGSVLFSLCSAFFLENYITSRGAQRLPRPPSSTEIAETFRQPHWTSTLMSSKAGETRQAASHR